MAITKQHVRRGLEASLILLGLAGHASAQQAANEYGGPAATPAAASTSAASSPGYQAVHITAGRSTVLSTDFDVVRLAVTNPAVADANVVQPREILIDAKAPGTISLILWGSNNRRAHYDLSLIHI